MKLVSPFLKHVVYPILAKTSYLHRKAGAGPAIVTYHGILPAGYKGIDPALDGGLVSAESFRRQLHLMKTQYNIVSPEQFLHWCESGTPLPPRSVLLTCDDGLQNTLTEMLPILLEFQLSCLFFVTGASLSQQASILWYEELYLLFLATGDSFTLEPIGELRISVSKRREKRARWWDLVKELSKFDSGRRREIIEQIREQLHVPQRWISKYVDDPASSRRFHMLTAPQLRQLAAAGMCIGAHTLSHPLLSETSDELAWSEIFDCRSVLEKTLDKKIWALAYPFGHDGSVTPRDLAMAERAGFKCAFLNFGGGLGAGNPLFALPRVHVTSEMALSEFEAHISGFHRSLRQYFSSETTDFIKSLEA